MKVVHLKASTPESLAAKMQKWFDDNPTFTDIWNVRYLGGCEIIFMVMEVPPSDAQKPQMRIGLK